MKATFLTQASQRRDIVQRALECVHPGAVGDEDDYGHSPRVNHMAQQSEALTRVQAFMHCVRVHACARCRGPRSLAKRQVDRVHSRMATPKKNDIAKKPARASKTAAEKP